MKIIYRFYDPLVPTFRRVVIEEMPDYGYEVVLHADHMIIYHGQISRALQAPCIAAGSSRTVHPLWASLDEIYSYLIDHPEIVLLETRL